MKMYKTKRKHALPTLATVRCCCSFRNICKVPHNSAYAPFVHHFSTCYGWRYAQQMLPGTSGPFVSFRYVL